MAHELLSPGRLVFSSWVRETERQSEERFSAVWGALRRLLVSELQRRHLWRAPPGYLGIEEAIWSRTALDELQHDCYVFIFLQRGQGLRGAVERSGDIEALVRHSLRNFLFERQKRYDPVGYLVYSMTILAVEQLLAEGLLFRAEEELDRPGGSHAAGFRQKVGNTTVLCFSPWLGCDAAVAPKPSTIETWGDLLMPDLATARGDRARRRVAQHLAKLTTGLEQEGVDGFYFRDLVEPLKRAARSRLGALHSDEAGELGPEGSSEEADSMILVPIVHPPSGGSERLALALLVRCVEALIDRKAEPRRQEELHRVWILQREHASRGDRMPSRRRIARVLGIDRGRISKLFAELARFARICQGEEEEA